MPGPAQIFEVVDIVRAQIERESVEKARDPYRELLRLRAVNLGRDLGSPPSNGVKSPAEFGCLLAGERTGAGILPELPEAKSERSSILILKPPALPIPRIGGGGNTRVIPS